MAAIIRAVNPLCESVVLPVNNFNLLPLPSAYLQLDRKRCSVPETGNRFPNSTNSTNLYLSSSSKVSTLVSLCAHPDCSCPHRHRITEKMRALCNCCVNWISRTSVNSTTSRLLCSVAGNSSRRKLLNNVFYEAGSIGTKTNCQEVAKDQM